MGGIGLRIYIFTVVMMLLMLLQVESMAVIKGKSGMMDNVDIY